MNMLNDSENIDIIEISPSATEVCTAVAAASGDDEHASLMALVTPPAVEKPRGRGRPRKAHPLTLRQRAQNQRIRDATRNFPTKEQAASPEYWKKWSLTALLEGVRRAIRKGYPDAVRLIAREMERRAQKAEEARADDDDGAAA